jgi:hypothetical protein
MDVAADLESDEGVVVEETSYGAAGVAGTWEEEEAHIGQMQKHVSARFDTSQVRVRDAVVLDMYYSAVLLGKWEEGQK